MVGTLNEPGGRIDLSARADGGEDFGFLKGIADLVEPQRHFPEPDDVGAQPTAAIPAAGVDGEVARPIPDPPAEFASGFEQFAVKVDDFGRTGSLMEVVDVLRHEGDPTGVFALKPSNGTVRLVWRDRSQLAAALVVETVDQGRIVGKTLGRGDFLYPVAFP